jgi:hypothetical protein
MKPQDVLLIGVLLVNFFLMIHLFTSEVCVRAIDSRVGSRPCRDTGSLQASRAGDSHLKSEVADLRKKARRAFVFTSRGRIACDLDDEAGSRSTHADCRSASEHVVDSPEVTRVRLLHFQSHSDHVVLSVPRERRIRAWLTTFEKTTLADTKLAAAAAAGNVGQAGTTCKPPTFAASGRR